MTHNGDLIKSYCDTGDCGKKRKKALTNGVFYLIKTGCQWRFFPQEYPPEKCAQVLHANKTKGNLEESDKSSYRKNRITVDEMLIR
ncbi:transposase [Holospora undulata]|uniref:Transposase n=1 Tax=Holospora undulata HU1 TaxID=1321371 RepID=A0A061JHV0_9PROT|nr:transposase [Holospora undulata]ETZ04509.1 hypothetical protein K737_301079 [Holospora undulata HU1]